jgi:hypothetical protein
MESYRLAIGTVAKRKLKGQCRVGCVDGVQGLGRRAAISAHSPQGPSRTEGEACDLIGQNSYLSRDAGIRIDSNQSPDRIRRFDDSEKHAVSRSCGHCL